MENVFTIRTPEDANRVVRLARGRNTVVVGAGFLGEQLLVAGWRWLIPRQCWLWEAQGASPLPTTLAQGWRWLPT